MSTKPRVSRKQEQPTAKPSFDPRKNYEWQPDDEFVLTGIEFSTLYNSLKEGALSPNGTSAANKVASYNILHSILVSGVEEGVIKEVKPPVENTPAPEKEISKVRKNQKNGQAPPEEAEIVEEN